MAANFLAVRLYQQIHFSEDVPGPHVGLLLREVGVVKEQSTFVKFGLSNIKKARASEIKSQEVDWLVF